MRIELSCCDELAFAIEGPESGPMALADVAPWAKPFALAWWEQEEATAFGDTGIVEVSGHETVSAAWKRALMLNHYGLSARVVDEGMREGDVPGHEFHGNQYAGGGGGSYKDTNGTDPAVNAALVASSGVKVSVPPEHKRDAEEALAHVLEDQRLLAEMRGMEVKFIPLERVHGRMGRALEISIRSLTEHGPGFAASIVRHELEHRILTRKGIPSSDQERRVRYTTGMWAALKAGSMAKTNPRAADGFTRAARDQGVIRESMCEALVATVPDWFPTSAPSENSKMQAHLVGRLAKKAGTAPKFERRWIHPGKLSRTQQLRDEAKEARMAGLMDDGWPRDMGAIVATLPGGEEAGKIRILDGHHRHGGALRAGLNAVPVVIVDEATVLALQKDPDLARAFPRTGVNGEAIASWARLQAAVPTNDRGRRYDRGGRPFQVQPQAYREAPDAEKFARAKKLDAALPALRRQVASDLGSQDERTRALATVVALIDRHHLRNGGGATEEETGSVGATSLRAEHVHSSKGGGVHLAFTGKSGVEWKVEVPAGPLAKSIRAFADGKKAGAELFPVSPGAVNSYVAKHAGEGITAKDFRTQAATELVSDKLSRAKPSDAKDAKGVVKDAVEDAAEELKHTAGVSRGSYVDPKVIEKFTKKAEAVSESAPWFVRRLWEGFRSEMPGFLRKLIEGVPLADKAGVGYVDRSTRPEQRCLNCASFLPDEGRCRRVEGAVAPEGWCRLWSELLRDQQPSGGKVTSVTEIPPVQGDLSAEYPHEDPHDHFPPRRI